MDWRSWPTRVQSKAPSGPDAYPSTDICIHSVNLFSSVVRSLIVSLLWSAAPVAPVAQWSRPPARLRRAPQESWRRSGADRWGRARVATPSGAADLDGGEVVAVVGGGGGAGDDGGGAGGDGVGGALGPEGVAAGVVDELVGDGLAGDGGAGGGAVPVVAGGVDEGAVGGGGDGEGGCAGGGGGAGGGADAGGAGEGDDGEGLVVAEGGRGGGDGGVGEG